MVSTWLFWSNPRLEADLRCAWNIKCRWYFARCGKSVVNTIIVMAV
jgi:hypothetical protein